MEQTTLIPGETEFQGLETTNAKSLMWEYAGVFRNNEETAMV